MRYSGDVVLRGRRVQVLSRSGTTPLGSQGLPTLFTYQSGDSLYFLHDSTFVLLYRFDAQPGDSWTTYSSHANGTCPQIPVRFTVDSVGVQQLAGRAVRWESVRLTTAYGTQPWGRIYEGIGGLWGFLPSAPMCGGTCPDYVGQLRSYAATGQPTLTPAPNGWTLRPLLATEARATQAGFVAWPNPTAGLLRLQVPPAMQAGARLAVYDVAGRQLNEQALPASGQLDLRGWPSGTYVLTLRCPGYLPLTRRVVVQ